MKGNLPFALVCALLTACSNDSKNTPDAGVIDPTGNWSVNYNFAPACGREATTTAGVFTVTLSPDGYVVAVPGVASTGSLVCTTEVCKLSGTFAWMASDTGYQQSMNVDLDANGAVTGNGTETVVTTDSTCTYTFIVSGAKS